MHMREMEVHVFVVLRDFIIFMVFWMRLENAIAKYNNNPRENE